MENLTEILNIPLLQALGVLLLIGIAELLGIPVTSYITKILKLNGNGKKEHLKEIDEKLDVIEGNHLEHIERDAQETRENTGKVLQILNEFKEYGIKVRKHD